MRRKQLAVGCRDLSRDVAESVLDTSARATFTVSSAMLRCLRGLEREDFLALDFRPRPGAVGRVGMAVEGAVSGLRPPGPYALPHPYISRERSLHRAPRGRRPSRLRRRPRGMGLPARAAGVPPDSLILTSSRALPVKRLRVADCVAPESHRLSDRQCPARFIPACVGKGR